MYLAAAGVGTLGVVDDDAVDLSNLQRQIIHATDRIGKAKVDSAGETVAAINPDISFTPHPVRLTAAAVSRTGWGVNEISGLIAATVSPALSTFALPIRSVA